MAYVEVDGVKWLEEEIQDDLKWSIRVNAVLHSGKSDFQSVELVDSGPFGKVLLLDGKAQSAEADERVYHEMLVHPALLSHPAPRRVFIAGGGEGATAREVLRHAAVQAVTMVDIDAVVCDFCERHLAANTAAFKDPRLTLIVDDAAAQLAAAPDGAFDVIIGDLADPVAGGPCFQLYTREFYEGVIAAKLAPGGVFVTQSGPAGVLTAGEVFAPIHHTLAAVFPRVLPLTAHIPSYADTWGWNIAFAAGVAGGGEGGEGGAAGAAGNGTAAASAPSSDLPATAAAADAAIAARIDGELTFLDGATLLGARALNKVVRGVLAAETQLYTVASPLFIHGEGLGK